jgi:arylsulfatase A
MHERNISMKEVIDKGFCSDFSKPTAIDRRERYYRRTAKVLIVVFIAAALAGCRADNGASSGISTHEPVLAAKQGFSGSKPNFIIIYADDLGYGDVGCYGNKAIKTPHIDRLAEGGLRLTDYYACSPVCAPSRIGLLTGRYPFRSGIIGNPYPQDEPLKRRLARKVGWILRGFGSLDLREQRVAPGIDPRELTLAEALQSTGYKTGMVGKWHLGDYSRQPEFNPLKHGFDFYLGVPHSNDMVPCPLYRNEQELEPDIGTNQARLTGLYTEAAVAFIQENRDNHFFLYVAHTFPHQPLYASDQFAGQSMAGKFGDAVEEIDWSVGQLVACLERNGLADNTLVIFTSDNGPWFEGSPGALRGRKGQSYEGGFRVPFIARWPGHVPQGGVRSEPVMNLDLFPTLLALAGLEPPRDRIIDGHDVTTLLAGGELSSPHEAIFFYHYDLLEGVRAGRWKYIHKTNRYVWPVPLDTAFLPDRLGKKQLGERWPLLYDLKTDPTEAYNVGNRYPGVADRLLEVMRRWQQSTEKNPGGWL